MESSSILALIHEKAIWTLSFMTSPNWPVTYIFCLELRYWTASTVNTLPPSWVQAMPFTTPIPLHSSFLCLFPKYSETLFKSMIVFSPFLATFLHILPIFLYSYLTPISIEYLITSFRASSLKVTKSSTPFSFNWMGSRWFLAIYNFSSRL